MKKTLRAVLAGNVIARRKALGMEQEDVEARSGVGQSTISRVERQETPLSLDKLERIAEALDCQAWELLVDDEEIRERAIRKALGGS